MTGWAEGLAFQGDEDTEELISFSMTDYKNETYVR